MLLHFIRPTHKKFFKIYDLLRVTLLTKLRLCCHISERKFRHNFADSLNSLCSFSLETESTLHFFLRCQDGTTLLRALTIELKNINDIIISLIENNLIHVIICMFYINFLPNDNLQNST